MTEPRRLKRPTFEVYYWDADGNEKGMDVVRPMPFDKWKDLIELQEKLIFFAVNKTSAIGSFLHHPDALSIVKKMAAMLIVIGKDKPGIDIDNLLQAGDYAQIGRIFLSETIDETDMAPTAFTASAIARIHGFDAGGKLVEFLKAKQAKELNTMLEEMKPEPEPEKVVEIKPETPPLAIGTSTPPPVAVAGIST